MEFSILKMKNCILFVFVVLALVGCGKKEQPKPYG